MKLEIDTDNKTIFIIGETSVLEVLDFLKGKELSEWKIKSKETVEFIPTYPQIFYDYDRYSPPFIVTC